MTINPKFKLSRDTSGLTPDNAHNAYWMARLSSLAYASKQSISDELPKINFKYLHFIENVETETQAFMCSSEGVLVMVFRGTEPQKNKDWLTDFKVKKVPFCDCGRVHRGFKEALESVWHSFMGAYEAIQQREPLDKLFITGHSLGGALAALATGHLLFEEGILVDAVYTFGQPRVGDATFASCMHARIGKRFFRFVNAEDIVTKLPLKALGYTHVGEVFYFDTRGTIYEGEKIWRAVRDVAMDKLDELFTPGISAFDDHLMDFYIKILATNVWNGWKIIKRPRSERIASL